MTAVYNLYEAKTSLSQLVDRAAAGEEIVIAKRRGDRHRQGGKAAGAPSAIQAAATPPPAGRLEARVRIADDFDAPLPPEIAAAFGARDENGDDRWAPPRHRRLPLVAG